MVGCQTLTLGNHFGLHLKNSFLYCYTLMNTYFRRMADITPSGMRQLLDEERGELMSRIRMSGGFSAHLYSEGVIDGFQRAHLEVSVE